MKIIASFILAIVVAGFAGDAPYNPTPDRYVDIHHSKIDIRVDLDDSTVTGNVTHIMSSLRTDLYIIQLDCEDTEIQQVLINNNRPLEYSLNGPKLNIELDRTYGFDDTLTLSIDYSAKPKKGLYFVRSDKGYPNKNNQAWTQGEGMDNHNWVPLWDYPNDRATFEVILTVDTPYTAVSNGEFVGMTDKGTTRTFHWHEHFPMVSYLISFVIGDFRRVEDSYGDLSIGYWVTPEFSDEDALRSFDRTPEMVAFFNEHTGISYPYEKLDQIIIDDFMWGGMENITLIHQSSGTMHTDRARPDHTSDGLVAHEIAHQWYGDMLTTRNWANAWLNEGFATFLTYAWREYDHGRDAAEFGRRWMLSSVRWADEFKRRPMVQYYYESDMDLFDSNIYAKGALVLNMLQQMLGYDAFWRTVRHYTNTYQFKNVESQDLKRVFEDVTGQNLEWFFDQWVYTGGLPHLDIKYKYNRRNQHVKLTIRQTQDVATSSLFRLPLTVLIDNGGDIVRQDIWIEEEESTFLIPSIRDPNMVLVDEGHIIPKRMEFNKTQSELIYQSEHAPHVLDRIWAIERLAEKKQRKRSIENALVHALQKDPFYGVRVEAAEALGQYKPKKGPEILMSSMQRQDNRVQRACIRSLSSYKTKEVKDFLIETMMTADNDYTVNDAYKTLFAVDSTAADSLYDWAMKQDSHRDMIRKTAIRSLRKYNASNYKRLKALLEYGAAPWSCRSTVVSTIGRHTKKHPELISTFEELLVDPNRNVRTTAARLLSHHGDESQVTNLENLIVRDPITERYVTPLIARLKGEEPAGEPIPSIKHELLEIRDRLDKLIKAQQD